MKKLFLSAFSLLTLNAISQTPVLLDTTMQRALLAKGYVDSKIDFRNFSVQANDGAILSNANLKNKVTFINFWFEQCAPCIAEFNALNGLYQKYKDYKDFQFITFTFESEKDIDRIRKEYKLQYPIIHLEKDNIYQLNFQLGFPTNMVVDMSGKIAFIKSGGFTEKSKAQEEFDRVYAKQVERVLLAQ